MWYLIYVQAFPHDISSVHELPADFRPPPIGNRADLIARILEVAPTADFTYPDWGVIPDPDGTGDFIEINLGHDLVVEGFALKLREKHAGPLAERIISHLGLRGVDIEAGDFFPVERPLDEDRKRWRRYQPPLPEGLTTREAAIEFLQARGYQAGARDWVVGESIWVYKSTFDSGPLEAIREHVYIVPDRVPTGRWYVMDWFSESFQNLPEALLAGMDYLAGCLVLPYPESLEVDDSEYGQRPDAASKDRTNQVKRDYLNWSALNPRAGMHVFRTREEMLEVWQEHQGAAENMPIVDFETSTAVCVFSDEGKFHRAPGQSHVASAMV